MTSLFLSGIPGVGKTAIIKRAQAIAHKLGHTVRSVSLGEILSENAERAGIVNLMRASPAIQNSLRSGGLVHQCVEMVREFGSDDHVIVDSPLTLMTAESVPYTTFDFGDFTFFKKSGCDIDRIVTLIDDPHTIAKNLAASDFATSIENILVWNCNENNRAADLASAYTKNVPIVTTKETAAVNLVKFLLDPKPNISYFGSPMSKIRDRADFSELAKKIDSVKLDLQSYVVLITPMMIADLAAATLVEKAHTKDRDLTRLIGRQVNWVIGYFPVNVLSSGFTRELTEGELLGKNCALIHPEPDKTPFGQWNTQYLFKTKEEFFAAISDARKNNKYNSFQDFTLPDGTPRYAKIMEAAGQLI